MTRVLVAGATGRLGKPVALQLQSSGFSVRALTRDPERGGDLRAQGLEVVRGDVSARETLDDACRGCDAVYISLRGSDDVNSYEKSEVAGVRNLVRAAHQAGVQRIAYISGAGRIAGNEHHFAVRVKTACEESLRSGGVPYTIFRATHFMESLPLFVRGMTAQVLGRQPHKYHYIAAADYARMVSRSLQVDEAANQTFTIFGPQPFTMHEALKVYLAHTHPGMPIKNPPLPLLRVIARLTGNKGLLFATQLFAAFAALGEEGDPEPANRLLGAPQTTLEDWARQQQRVAA